MAYDPERHHRRSIRLADYDYRQNGAYYVTICTHERECLFGEVDGDGRMRLNALGEIVWEEWEQTGIVRANIILDAFIVMPNHVHGILVFDDARRGVAEGCTGMARHAPTATQRRFAQPIAGSLATIIGAFKSAASRRINCVARDAGMDCMAP